MLGPGSGVAIASDQPRRAAAILFFPLLARKVSVLAVRTRILIATFALALVVPTVATAAPKSDDSTFRTMPSAGRLSASITPRVLASDALVNVMVEMSGNPVAVEEAEAGHEFTTAQRSAVRAKLRKAQNAISDDIAAKGGKVMSHMQSAYNGMRVRISTRSAAGLAKLPGVTAVHSVPVRTLDNTASVPYLGVPAVWQNTGKTGKGVKVAVIDTGIDYTHADFGGPGSPADFAKASATSAGAAPAAMFGPTAPRVKGGYDFVGDDYDASADEGSPALVPHPDSNPLDCNGHGTHVAGTVGGSGVTSSGSTYAGHYNSATAGTSFKVGPGVAPQVDLYALRVFGCEGSTEVTTEAIDWAVAQDMDVINLSLGSTFGRSTDPDAVAASNAVGAGVVVVASAGNSGQNPYLTGSPAAGAGVISVAAVDSIRTFGGVKLQFPGSTLTAINANGAGVGAGSFTLVNVLDDPDTTENEALGCSKAAYLHAGIGSGGRQIAVVSRGSCARVAKAIFGQQAGAAAVVMVNDEDGFPPYEGEIRTNPDDGTSFLVTIPFLGVSAADGAALLAADTESLTLSATTLTNPGYRGFGSFTSGGPVNGDSGLSPNLAAPGVSIASAAVGSGTGAEVMSGTSMAAPHVTGVAALGVQAHPSWDADDVAAAVVSTADPANIPGYSVRLGGTGLVDAAQTVKTTSFVTGDGYRTTSGSGAEASLSFGFSEPASVYRGTKAITIHNRSNKPVTYTLASRASAQSRPASLTLSTKKVTVRANSTAKVRVSLAVAASRIGSSIGGDDQFGFHEVSGTVSVTFSGGVLRVPYLLVPRAQASVTAALTQSAGWTVTSAAAQAVGGVTLSNLKVKLANAQGALAADADFYTWGLADGKDVAAGSGGKGYDLRAAGVQSFDTENGTLLVFAVNTHDRWSTAASQEFDVSVDTDSDGDADYVVFSYDSGAASTGDPDGLTGVYVYDVAANALVSSGYYAQAPTDSSTILLPVLASDLVPDGATLGAFSYTVSSSSLEDSAAYDEFDDWAGYNPSAKAIADGDYVTVARHRTVTVPVAVDGAALALQKPKGVMVVVYDNKSGAREALLLGVG